MGKQQQVKRKKRLNGEVILTLVIVWITIAFLVLLALAKVDQSAPKSKMKVPNVEAPQVAGIAREKTDMISCDTEINYTQRQLLMKKSGLEPDESLVNWVLAEGIGSYVEYSVGNRAMDFAGYDFDEVQQLVVKRIVNQLNNAAFPNDFYRLIIEDDGSSCWKYVCRNHPRARENTMINVLKVLYLEDDYDIPDNVYYQNVFRYSDNIDETENNDGEVIVSDPYEAFDYLCEQGISTSLYPYSSYIFLDSQGDKRLLIFCGCYDFI